MTQPIATPTDLEQYEAGDPARAIAAATAAVRAYCGWHVTPITTEDVVVVGSGARTVQLPSLHVTAVHDVVNAGTVYPDDQTCYTWTAAGQLVRAASAGIWVRDGAVTATITHGYPEAADVQAVILAAAARSRANPRSASDISVGPFREAYGSNAGSGFTEGELATLDLYRLPPRP